MLDADDVVGPEAQGIDPGEFRELIQAMRSGSTYVNVHTEGYPGGEIRGQIRGARRLTMGKKDDDE